MFITKTYFYNHIFFKLINTVKLPVKTVDVSLEDFSHIPNGALFFGRRDLALMNCFLPKKICHVGMLWKEHGILEFIYPVGFNLVSIKNFCERYTKVWIKRICANELYIKFMINRFISFRHREYDKHFRFNNKAFYCSEAIYNADHERMLDISTKDFLGLGWEYVSPYGVFKSSALELVKKMPYSS